MFGVELYQDLAQSIDRDSSWVVESRLRDPHAPNAREIRGVECDDLTGRLHDPKCDVGAGRRGNGASEQGNDGQT
jgi:hypothetical protein